MFRFQLKYIFMNNRNNCELCYEQSVAMTRRVKDEHDQVAVRGCPRENTLLTNKISKLCYEHCQDTDHSVTDHQVAGGGCADEQEGLHSENLFSHNISCNY